MAENKALTLVLFDLDGTLTQTFHSEDRSFTKALSQLIELDAHYSYWAEIEHPTDEAVFRHLFKKITGKEASQADKQQMLDLYIKELMLSFERKPGFFDEVPGANELLHELLNRSDTVVGISTGSWSQIARLKLELAGIHYRDIPIACCDQFPDKLSFTKELIESFKNNVPIGDIFYVGDSLYDYKVSQSLGMNFIGIDFRQDGRLNELSFCPVFPDLRYLEL